MSNPVVHFEIPVNDIKRAKHFYEKIFGWKIEYIKEFDYYSIKAKEKNEGIDGGMMVRKSPGQPVTSYIKVDSIDSYLKKVIDMGGRIALDKHQIGDVGAIGAFFDTEGNLIGLHEETRKQ
jgi:uncharacterized protein